ncbi:hypothetical protein HYT74_03085 [Candidatus Daviesbacteria bacterium]|nr:hypothetical protein [Candidatus Daviesbacteria bacterium]MBI4038391.1 hypothetical protein [Candidatus Daviesbacteria bacterium]
MKFQFPLFVYFLWYLIILFFQIFLQPIYLKTAESLTLYQRLYLSWVSYWDSAHYVSIAANGYKYPQQAFFPMWPLVIKITSFILPPLLATFILSFIFGLLTFVFFYFLAKKLTGEYYAKMALIFFACFPSTFILHAGYTEGLFLTLTLLSFLLMEQRKYLLSAILAGFSSMTRLAGVGIAISYLLLKQSIFKRFTLLTIGISGILFYMLYLQTIFGNGFIFIDAQKEWCKVQGRCNFVFPLIPLINYANLLLAGWLKPSLSTAFLDWLFSVIFLILLLPVTRKLGFTYFIYSLVVLILPLFSTTVGMVRYVLVAFPVFFVIPSVIKSKILFFIVCILLFLLELRFVTLFTNRMWVA